MKNKKQTPPPIKVSVVEEASGFQVCAYTLAWTLLCLRVHIHEHVHLYTYAGETL